jgi:6-phosphogluconolactonase
MPVSKFHEFRTKEELAQSFANDVSRELMTALNDGGHARLAVSGGSTPKLFFDHLSRQKLDWKNVQVMLVDDRCVPADHERSNQLFVRQHLLKNEAADADFGPLENVEADFTHAIDYLVLGMGADGHTASFFPNGDTLAAATDLNTKQYVLELTAPGALEPRVTMTLPVIASATHIALHIEGDEKRRVFEEASKEGSADELPIRHVLRHPQVEIEVYWAP